MIIMEPGALIRRIRVSVTPASLNDTASDWDRLARAARPFLDDRPIEATLTALRELGPALRQSNWQVVVTLADCEDAWRVLSVKQNSNHTPLLGIAMDLGTTTIIGTLVDIESKSALASRMILNGQRQFGGDVTTRMMYAEKPNGLEALRQTVTYGINQLIAELCSEAGADADTIMALVIAGNTVMMHLLLGMDPGSIRCEPYVPSTTCFPILNTVQTGLAIHVEAPLYLFPAASGYVGGDVTAGLLATGMADRETLSILIDIGTNGETVLGGTEFLLACSGSAGSAFEGCGLEFGMPAQPGAIDHVRVNDGQIFYQTIGGQPAKGICGSGLIEALSAFLDAGIIDRGGKVNTTALHTRCTDNRPEVVIAPAASTSIGKDIALRQTDIENLIRDKAALFAGSRILLSNAGLTYEDIAEIMIAGSFGQSLEVEKAVHIGLLPEIPLERIRFIGNSSLAGAQMALLSNTAWNRAQSIASSITCLELTTELEYFKEYTAALFLPHTDLSLFPSAMKGS